MKAEEYLRKSKAEKIDIIKEAIRRLMKTYPSLWQFNAYAIAREIIVEGKEDALPEDLHWQMHRVAHSITSLLSSARTEKWRGKGIGWSVDFSHPNAVLVYYLTEGE